MADKYKEALHEAQQELARIEERRGVLLRLILNLKELSEDEWYELTPTPGYIPKGMTEEIRTIMALTTVHLDPVQIRDSLIARGLKYNTPRNLLINVHTVLDRIKGDLSVAKLDGKNVYKAKSALGLGAKLGVNLPYTSSGLQPPFTTPLDELGRGMSTALNKATELESKTPLNMAKRSK